MGSSKRSSRDIILPITIEEWFRSYRLDELKKYLDVTEKYLRTAKSDFETHLNEQNKKLSTAKLSYKELDEINEFYSEERWRYEEKFPRILRNSFLVAAISLLEYEISVIYHKLKRAQQIPMADSTSDSLEQAKLCWKVVGLGFPDRDKMWQELNYYYKVRNCIVHTNGLVMELQYKYRKALIPYITEKGIISQDTIEQEIALTEQFCKEVVETIQSFLVELEKNINLKLNRKNTTKGV